MGDKAQIHTLEGFAAAFVIVFAVIFGLQAAATGSPTTLDEEVGTYDAKLTNDVLLQSNVVGEGETQSQLESALLNWTRTDGFNGSDDETYYTNSSAVPGRFGETLGILDGENITYNIDLVCDGTSHAFVRSGDGGKNVVTSSVTVTLNDDDTLADGTRLDNAVSYPCDDMDEDGVDTNLYNVVEVRITAWRG